MDLPRKWTLLSSTGIVVRLVLSLTAFFSVMTMPGHSVGGELLLALAGLASAAGVVALRFCLPPPFARFRRTRGLMPITIGLWGVATATAAFAPQYADYAAGTLLAFLVGTSVIPPLAVRSKGRADTGS